MTEREHQIQFLRHFRTEYPEHKIFSIPNGARLKSPRHANILKAEGMTPGVPDLFVPSLCLWIEMKAPGTGKLSEVQKVMIDYLQSFAGHHVIVGYGFQDAVNKLEQLIKLREMATMNDTLDNLPPDTKAPEQKPIMLTPAELLQIAAGRLALAQDPDLLEAVYMRYLSDAQQMIEQAYSGEGGALHFV